LPTCIEHVNTILIPIRTALQAPLRPLSDNGVVVFLKALHVLCGNLLATPASVALAVLQALLRPLSDNGVVVTILDALLCHFP
jgi:hypothetical protein